MERKLDTECTRRLVILDMNRMSWIVLAGEVLLISYNSVGPVPSGKQRYVHKANKLTSSEYQNPSYLQIEASSSFFPFTHLSTLGPFLKLDSGLGPVTQAGVTSRHFKYSRND